MKRIPVAFLCVMAVALVSCSSPDSEAAKEPSKTDATTYSVIYDGNGCDSGIAPIDASAYEAGASAKVVANTGNLAKAEYAFDGWNTAKDGSETAYAPGDTLTIGSANVTLYAQWARLYSVTYDANGGSGGVPIDSGAYRSGGVVTVRGNMGGLTLSVSSFAGWNTKANGSGTAYTEGETFRIGSANVILYALWTKLPTYSVTYDKNGADSGSAPTDTTAYLAGATVHVPGNTGSLALHGYSFAGWNDKPDGPDAVTYTAGDSFTMGSKAVTLYAKWTAQPTYTVTYHKNDADSGNVPTDDTRYLSGDNASVLDNTGNLVKAGYTFKGWTEDSSGGGTAYVAHDELLIGSGNVDLYALWESTTGGASISMTIEPFVVVLDAPETVPQGQSFTAKATNDAMIDSWQWYLDSECVTDQVTGVFAGGGNLGVGPHTITAEVIINSVIYSKSARVLIQAK